MKTCRWLITELRGTPLPFNARSMQIRGKPPCCPRSSLVAVMLAMLANFSTLAATVYVNSEYTGAVENGQAGTPYRTVTRAADNAAPGDTLSLRRAVYCEAFRLTKPLRLVGREGIATIFHNPPCELLPDLFVQNGGISGSMEWRLDRTEQPDRVLLRLTTATPNRGQGPLELRGSPDSPQVYQRIYNNAGGYADRLAGTFTFHPSHGHLHFDDYMQFHLREVTAGNGVGSIIRSGAKVSFAIVDLVPYDLSLSKAPADAQYFDGYLQGISVGWADSYDRSLPDQWIDVTGVAPRRYWLEAVVDPSNRIREANENNNVRRVMVDLTEELLPDLYVENGGAHESMEWMVDRTTEPGEVLLRLTTVTPNIGPGPLELRGSTGSDAVYQRIFDSDGGHSDRLAGTFSQHVGHGHLHFDDYIQFHLRAVTAGNQVGNILRSGDKISFEIRDLARHDTSLQGAPSTVQYTEDLAQNHRLQGISVGWKDSYGYWLDEQWINVTGVLAGQYWLEAVVDPSNRIREANEGNNVTRILISLDP